MRKFNLTVTSSQRNPEIEKLILTRDKHLKDLAQKNAQHFAKRNLPSPEDGSLGPYTNDIRSGYEALQAEMLQKLQPATHFPESSMDADHLKEKDKQLDVEIKKREDLNKNEEYEMGQYRPTSIRGRLQLALFVTIVLTVGETIFNAISFSVFGENLLFSLLLSFAISIAVLTLAHFGAFLIKAAKTSWQRWGITIATLVVASGLLSALAVFRSNYLAYHNVYISPFYFYQVNLFFFLVAGLISVLLLPTWQDIKDNMHKLKLEKDIKKRKSEVDSFKEQKANLKKIVLDNTKVRLRDAYYATYQIGYINKLYRETLEQFKTCNLSYRTDGQVPQCFNDSTSDLHKPEYDFLLENPVEK